MQTPVSNSEAPRDFGWRSDSTSSILFAVGVALLICGGTIAGDHHWNMVGLGLIIFSSLVHLE